MMNYLHNEKDRPKLIKTYFIALIPFLLFGFYKNGLLLFQNKLISFIDCLIPLYIYIISAIIGYIISRIRKEDYQENVLMCLIISCTISINTNLIIYPILLFVSFFILKYIQSKTKFNFNYLACLHLMMILALLFQNYSYLNVAEKINIFNYNLFDIFLGHTSGGVASSSILMAIISLFILIFNPFYKKRIALASSLSYFLVFLICFLIKQDYSYLNLALNGSAYFAFIMVASDLYTGSYHNMGMLIYGLFIGIASALLSYFLPIYETPYIVIFLFSFFCPLLNRFFDKKYLQAK